MTSIRRQGDAQAHGIRDVGPCFERIDLMARYYF